MKIEYILWESIAGSDIQMILQSYAFYPRLTLIV